MPLERMGATRSFLREFIEAVPGAVYAKDCDGRILLGNAGFAEAVGWRAGGFVGKTDLELLADEALAQTVMENDRQIIVGGRRRQVEEQLRDEGGATSYWLSTKAPFTDDSGKVAGLVGVSINITERKRLEEREKLLAREVEHRNKNLLGVVQSVVRLTTASTTEEFRQAVAGRLEALDRVHGVLNRERRQEIDLRDLLLEELAAYRLNAPGRVRLEGPPAPLDAGTAQPLAMAVHELATNAAKYGAFADPSGVLEVTWELAGDAEGELQLDWRESRAGAVEPPRRQGFGTRLIRSVVQRQLGGAVSLGWETGGLHYRIALPLARS